MIKIFYPIYKFSPKSFLFLCVSLLFWNHDQTKSTKQKFSCIYFLRTILFNNVLFLSAFTNITNETTFPSNSDSWCNASSLMIYLWMLINPECDFSCIEDIFKIICTWIRLPMELERLVKAWYTVMCCTGWSDWMSIESKLRLKGMRG